jgi:hypothetical protein
MLTRLPGDMDCDAAMRAVRSVDLSQAKYDAALAKHLPPS